MQKDTLNKPKIFSVANQKGGVGKTTTTVNLATAFAAAGKKSLILDLDPQGNASTGLGIERKHRTKCSYDVLVEDSSTEEAIQPSFIPNLDIIPSSPNLAGAEIELVNQSFREFKLDKAFKKAPLNEYDAIFIDCPPSLGLLTVNAFVASTSVIVPLQCEFYALEGLSFLLQTVEHIRNSHNPGLNIEGIILTMFDKRNRLSTAVSDEVREHFGKLVYQTVIPRNVKVSEAPSYGKPAIIYDFNCTGSQAYVHLAKEVFDRSYAHVAA